MSQLPSALLRIKSLSKSQIHDLFELAVLCEKSFLQKGHCRDLYAGGDPQNRIVSLMFFEPSSRTRFSFAIAAHRMGFRVIDFAADSTTSIAKGETQKDTFLNLAAMLPDLIVLRHNGDPDLEDAVLRSKTPIINAGDGVGEHPTQALLDGLTIVEKRGRIEGEKILFVGDVPHSRVARSGRDLFQICGAEVATCGPENWRPTDQEWAKSQHFTGLQEALNWATVCIGLRIQTERHADRQAKDMSAYRLDPDHLRKFRQDGVIMHPGPFIPGVDLDSRVLDDKRCAIHRQVTNGVFIRAALMARMLGEKK